MRSDHPPPRAARSGRYLLAALALLLLAAGGVLYWLLPAATGYASHYLCVRVLAGGEADPQTVFEREVKPINPLFRVVTYRIDRDTATASAAGLGLLRKTVALYRPGLGCTVSPATDLDALRAQGQGLGLPAASDPETPGAAEPPALAKVLDRALAEPGPKSLRNTLAVVVRQHGAIVGERYAPGVGTETPLLGWSMTKTVTGLLAGTLVADGKLSLDQTDLMPEWSAPDDPRRSIQLRNLLQWNSGLDYHEGYLPGSDTTTMLYQSADMAHFVASRPLAQPPGHQVDYQSGGSVLVANIAARALSSRPLAIVPFARARLFAPLGIHTAMLEPDAAGTLVGGSYMLASARDWSKIGQLILQHGEWRGRRIVDADWIRFMSTPQTALGDSQHGAHLWLNAGLAGERRFPSLPEDLTMLDGFNYQLVVIVPSCQAVITRLGATVDRSWNTETFVHDVMASLPGCTPPLKTAMR
ncbi:class C beta-lactamase-related serine hydrolase [Burkholderia glumae]|uniref:serine hydrolase domain-containing protein n=1 Tax=Burkholderia glumae TaxID=337 RepID=UPI000F5F7375|nr:serine hydrolase [Burkholderia glumae]MCQ0033455.1 beta-lactamase family protein [Burkholderia glumae]MCQ0036794.1 beta-lactamase family protein [Burkholderia glumae]MCR1767359.1 serine hydrolase [Burkholderia glumae]QHP94547.1 class C beta-lactamase-related serine hydrolase [Burkholderia glumae]QJW82161.1 serine hydrolase [Burkholderia glumae]